MTDEPTTPYERFVVLQERGRTFYKHQRFEQARQVWEEALRLAAAEQQDEEEEEEDTTTDGGSIPTLEQQKTSSNLVACLLQLRLALLAVQEAHRCIALDATWAKGHLRLAEAHCAAGNRDASRVALETVLQLDPGHAAALQQLQQQQQQQQHDGTTTPDLFDKGQRLIHQTLVRMVTNVLPWINSLQWTYWAVAAILLCTKDPWRGRGLVAVTISNVLVQRFGHLVWPLLQGRNVLTVQHKSFKRYVKRMLQFMVVAGIVDLIGRCLYETYMMDPCAKKSDNPYHVLGIRSSLSTTTQDISKAYRKLSLKCHPDKRSRSVGVEKAHADFVRLGEAKQVLTDPIQRPVYDLCGVEGLDIWSKLQLGRRQPPNVVVTPDLVCDVVTQLRILEQQCGREAKRLVLEQGMNAHIACQLSSPSFYRQNYYRDDGGFDVFY